MLLCSCNAATINGYNLPKCYAILGVSCYFKCPSSFQRAWNWQEPCRPWFYWLFHFILSEMWPKSFFVDLSIFHISFHPKWNFVEFLQALYLLGLGTIKFDFQLPGRRTQVRRPIFMHFHNGRADEYGRIYILYRQEDLARELGKSISTVKRDCLHLMRLLR